MFKKVAVTGVLLAPFGAQAALDPAIATGLTALQADAATLGGLAMAAVVAITLIGLGIRLAKRMMSKAV